MIGGMGIYIAYDNYRFRLSAHKSFQSFFLFYRQKMLYFCKREDQLYLSIIKRACFCIRFA